MKRYSELTINGENRWEDVQAFGQAIRIESATSGRYSTLLLIQLYIHTVLRQAMNPGKVIHEIEALEGKGRASKTKPALPFKHAPLKGLWHKHYLADGLSTMARNLLNGLRKDGLPWVEERVREASEAGEERYITLEDVNAITHDAVIGNWQRRLKWTHQSRHSGG